MKHGIKARRVRGIGAEQFALEAMEGRTLFNADLAISWDTSNFHIPAALVPGDTFDPNGGSNRIEAPFLLANQGPLAAVGTVRVDFYLSSDTSLNTSQDTLLRSYASNSVSLSVYNGDPSTLGSGSPTMTIPATVAPGSYFLIVRIVPDGNIGDFNSSNNIAVSDDPITLVRKFGNFSGRTDVVLTLQDPEGTSVSFGATGGGYGEVVPGVDGFGVTLTGTGNATLVNVSNTGGDGRYDFTSVAINGSVGTFNAPNARLRGPMTATTGFGAMTMGDVIGPLTITVPATSQAVSFTFADVKELTLTSAVGINAISVKSWTDLDSTADSITAPWIGTLTSTGNFYPNMYLSGRSGANTLGAVNVGGVIKDGDWSINGTGGALTIFASTVFWSASYSGAVPSLTMGGSYRGVFTASSIGSISAGRDILYGRILAGAFLGSDGALGGAGGAADTFGPGTIGTVFAAHNAAGNIMGAGLDPVDGVFKNGNDRIVGGTQSSIGNITIGNIAGAVTRFLSNGYGTITFGGAAIDWTTNVRFRLSTTGPAPTLVSTVLTTSSGHPFLDVTIRFDSTSLANLTSIVGAAVRITGPNGLDRTGTVLSKVYTVGTFKASATAVFHVGIASPTDGTDPGTYTIELLSGFVKDFRGNDAIAGVLGTFEVM
jgi:hypothetical protein